MRTTSWNEAEDEALDYLPLVAQLVYLRVLRRNMDYATGIVGLKRRISYRSIIEWMEVRSGLGGSEGVTTGLTLDGARWVIKILLKHGLIVRVSGYERTLVFKLPHATTDQSDPVKYPRGTPEPDQTNSARDSTTPKPNNGAGCEDNDTTNNTRVAPEPDQTNRATHPVSGNTTHSMRARAVDLQHTISETWQPSRNTIEQARIHGLPDATDQSIVLAFVSYNRGKGTVASNWDQMFIKWLNQERVYQQEKASGTCQRPRRSISAADRIRKANSDAING